MGNVGDSRLVALISLILAISVVFLACGTETVEVTREVQVEVEVTREVEVEKQVQVEVTREVEVLVEVEREVLVEKEVLVEVTARVERGLITFSDLNWPSAEIQTRIAKYIVEHGYGYPTDTISGDTISMWEGLINNDTDVTMEIWLPNQQEVWNDALESGVVVDVGKSLEDNWQGFVIPQYVKDANPGLVSVTDIPEYIDLFVTPDSNDKARLVTCIPGWECERVNANKVLAYDLENAVELVNPGSGAALFADLEGAYARGDNWLGYLWGPTKPSAELDLYILEEPAYTQECWEDDQGCAYPTAEIKIAVHESLIERAPDLVQFFRKWDFTAATHIATEAWMTENNEAPDTAAIYYLKTFGDVWEAFVPEDVAARVNQALAAEG